VYEKGVALFKYPHVGPIWAAYLKAFVERYGGTKLERARDLFESALEGGGPSSMQLVPYCRLILGHQLACFAGFSHQAQHEVSSYRRLAMFTCAVCLMQPSRAMSPSMATMCSCHSSVLPRLPWAPHATDTLTDDGLLSWRPCHCPCPTSCITITGCPPDQALALYLDYAKLEESHGLARHAMEVYERAIGGVPKEQRLQVVDLYLSKATDFFGIAKVRVWRGGGGTPVGSGWWFPCRTQSLYCQQYTAPAM
jgi:hypothetical protein